VTIAVEDASDQPITHYNFVLSLSSRSKCLGEVSRPLAAGAIRLTFDLVLLVAMSEAHSGTPVRHTSFPQPSTSPLILHFDFHAD